MNQLEILLREDSQEIFEPSKNDYREWFAILNDEIFSGEFSFIPKIDIRFRRKNHAYYQYEDKRFDPKESMFLLDKRYKTKKMFVEILAHELVHHYQYMNGFEVDHGKSFFKWKKIINKKGLALAQES
jgi:hypothetical protein